MFNTQECEDGFTLVEILVVILIIGILAAIAIPVFLNQRQTANDAAVESDVKNGALAMETYFTSNPTANTATMTEIRALMGAKSADTRLIFVGTRNDFCVWGTHANAKVYTNWISGTSQPVRPYYLYQSANGGTIDSTSHMSTLACHDTYIGSWN